MSRSKFSLGLSLSREVMDALAEKSSRTGVSKSAWAEKALREALLGSKAAPEPQADHGNASESSRQIEVGAKISNTLDKKLMEMVQKKPELLESLDDKTIAQLLVARAPKPRDGDVELELSYLSLTESLSRLPDVEDLAKELARTKLHIDALLCEAESMRQVLDNLGKRLWKNDGFDWSAFRKILNEWQSKVIEVARRAGDVMGVTLPDFHVCLLNPRRSPEALRSLEEGKENSSREVPDVKENSEPEIVAEPETPVVPAAEDFLA